MNLNKATNQAGHHYRVLNLLQNEVGSSQNQAEDNKVHLREGAAAGRQGHKQGRYQGDDRPQVGNDLEQAGDQCQYQGALHAQQAQQHIHRHANRERQDDLAEEEGAPHIAHAADQVLPLGLVLPREIALEEGADLRRILGQVEADHEDEQRRQQDLDTRVDDAQAEVECAPKHAGGRGVGIVDPAQHALQRRQAVHGRFPQPRFQHLLEGRGLQRHVQQIHRVRDLADLNQQAGDEAAADAQHGLVLRVQDRQHGIEAEHQRGQEQQVEQEGHHPARQVRARDEVRNRGEQVGQNAGQNDQRQHRPGQPQQEDRKDQNQDQDPALQGRVPMRGQDRRRGGRLRPPVIDHGSGMVQDTGGVPGSLGGGCSVWHRPTGIPTQPKSAAPVPDGRVTRLLLALADRVTFWPSSWLAHDLTRL